MDTSPALTLSTLIVSAANNQVPDSVDATNTGWNLQLLNGSVQGTTLYQRVGQKVVLKKLVAKLLLAQSQAGTATQSNNAMIFRVMFVYDQQPNGATITAPNLAAAVLKTNTNICSPQNLDNRERFRVLGDKYYYVGGTNYLANGDAVSVIPTEQYMKLCKKFKAKLDLDTCYNSGNSGGIGDIQTGALYLLVGVGAGFNNVSTGSVSAVAAGFIRVRFYDA